MNFQNINQTLQSLIGDDEISITLDKEFSDRYCVVLIADTPRCKQAFVYSFLKISSHAQMREEANKLVGMVREAQKGIQHSDLISFYRQPIEADTAIA